MRARRRWLVLCVAASSLVLPGCALPVREGYFGCALDSDCPPGLVCRTATDHRCYSTRDALDAATDASADASADASSDASSDTGRDAFSVTLDGGTDAMLDAASDASSDPNDAAVLDAAGVDAAGFDAGSDGGTDAGNDGGHDAGHDASTFTPSGTFTITPSSAYQCHGNLYDFNVGAWAFTDNGTTLTAHDPNTDIPCDLTGTSARSTGTFDVMCSATLSACTATFELTGSFTADRTWTGSFQVTFFGGGCNTSPVTDSCTSRTFSSITGTR